MIYYNSNTINGWNYGDDNIIKVYRNGAVVFYKFDSEQGGYKVCFAVVADITEYQDTEFEDVYDKATEKWFKLNNLNQYEQYGIYGEGRNITYYDGKLTVDDGYEYEWNGSSWVNVGEISGSSITIKSPEYIAKTSSYNTGQINLGYTLKDNTKFQIKIRPTSNGGGACLGEISAPSDSDDYRIFWYSNRLYYDYGNDRKYTSQAINNTYEYEVGNYYVKNLVTSATVLTGTTKSGTATSHTRNIYAFFGVADYCQIYYLKIYEGDTLVKDFIPWTDMNGNYGFFDKVSLTYIQSTNQLTASTTINDVEVGGGVEYPIYYDEIQDPPNNVTFTSMTEAESYECPWVGMVATIAGDRYVFSGNSQSGYEWVYNPSRLPQGYTEVEYIENTGTSTSNGAYINSGLKLYDVVGNSFSISGKVKSEYYTASGYDDLETIINSESVSSPYYGFTYRYAHSSHILEFTNTPSGEASFSSTANTDGSNSIVINCNSTTVTDQVPLGLFASYNGNYNTPYRFAKATIYSLTVVKNGTTVRDFVPCQRNSDSVYGLYDLITDTFYTSPNGNNFIGGDPV